jgi:hypothetical protein
MRTLAERDVKALLSVVADLGMLDDARPFPPERHLRQRYDLAKTATEAADALATLEEGGKDAFYEVVLCSDRGVSSRPPGRGESSPPTSALRTEARPDDLAPPCAGQAVSSRLSATAEG